MHKVILDTDIGTDVDDLLALTFLLNSPEIELLGITAAYGNTSVRGKLAYRILSLAGRETIPVTLGDSQTLLHNRNIFWPGHEGKNAKVEDIPDTVLSKQSAVDFILETIRKHPGEIILCTVAPLTNIAQAIIRDPDTMSKVKHIVMMGGVFGFEDVTLSLPVSEHNFRCDPEAARVVFNSDLPITLFPLDVTLKTPFMREDLEQLRGQQHPLLSLVVQEIETWLEVIKKLAGRDYCHLHDPLAAASIVDPGIVTQKVATSLKIECQGELTSGLSMADHSRQANVQVVTGIDLSRFYELFMRRMKQPAKPSQTVTR
jgi:purine nucleosidase